MIDQKLYGRDDFIDETVAKITGGTNAVILIHGPTGMGKTVVVKSIEEILQSKQQRTVTYYQVEGNIQAYEEPFLKFLRDILASLPPDKVTVQKVIDSIKVNAENKLARIASGLYQDLIKRLAIEKTAAAIGEIFVEAADGFIDQAHKLARQERESFYTEYMETLRAITPSLSEKPILIIDQLEASSETMLSFVESFSKYKPTEIVLLIIVNNETLKGVECINSIQPLMQEINTEVIELQGITEDDLQQWVEEEKHFNLSLELSRRAIREFGGRPLFIKSWIDYGEFTFDSLKKPRLNIWGYYNELFTILSREAKELAILLSPIPLALPMGVTMISHLSLKPQEHILLLLHELEHYRFIERDQNKYRYSHELIRKFVLNRMPPSDEIKQRILSALETEFGLISASAPQIPLIEAKVELLPSVKGRDGFEFLCSLANRQLEEGSYNSALNFSDQAIAMLKVHELTMEDHARLRLIKAKIFEQVGEYGKGVEELSGVDDSQIPKPLQAQIYTQYGELFLRWNRYDESLQYLSRAEEVLVELNDQEALALVLIRKGDVFRDTEKDEEALELARKLKTEIMPTVTRELLKAHIHRSISRAFTLLGDPVALEEALRAKEIAIRERSKKSLGNALFVIGEACRSMQKYPDAAEAYQKGLDIAHSFGHKDLEIYCLLGSAAAKLPFHKLPEAEYHIEDLEKIDPSKFPVESLHTRMLRLVLKLIRDEVVSENDLDSLNYEYIRFSRTWPGKFIKDLSLEPEVQKRFVLLASNPLRL